jgi:hypothetical protein
MKQLVQFFICSYIIAIIECGQSLCFKYLTINQTNKFKKRLLVNCFTLFFDLYYKTSTLCNTVKRRNHHIFSLC